MPSNIPAPVIDLMPFVPAEDFALSQRFYADLGFITQWADERTAELRIGSFGFCCRISTSSNMQVIS